MNVSDFDYKLPGELIAQEPAESRDSSKLLVVSRKGGKIIHDRFYNLPNYLLPGDLLVFNDTKVMPARLYGRKETGGKIEILLLNSKKQNGIWEFVGRNIGQAKHLSFGGGLEGEVMQPGVVKFNIGGVQLTQLINKIGHTPLPPYIRARGGASEPNVKRRYQTVYAKHLGSAAAPTAGLHFSKKLIKKLSEKGIEQTFVTLHVGLGTFEPVRTEKIQEHKMHGEYFSVSQKAKIKIQNHKLKGKRIVAVGTTSVRALESEWDKNETNIFIYPGYKFKYMDAMITNFHLPKSTLLMLVSAFAGRKLIMRAYAEAIKEKYRFFSFGDAMLIL